jgi:pimeloyl-ACP methyl ester carboxylesterase
MTVLLVAAALAFIGAGLLVFTLWQARRFDEAYRPGERFVEIGPGARLHLADRRPPGPARASILLLHGASANHADMLLPLGERLVGAGYRVLAPDRPGHGWSDRPGGRLDASPVRQALLIRAALERCGVERVVVVGFSWSGALACHFALDHPDFTAGLVLLAPVTHPWPGGIAWYYPLAANPWIGALFSYTVVMPAGLLSLRSAVNGVFSPQRPPPGYVEAVATSLVLRPREFMANAQDVAGLYRFVCEQAPRLGAIARPVAIVAGDRDTIVWTSIHARASASQIPGARLEIIEGAGHSVHYVDPGRVAAAIIAIAQEAG